jgi:dihydroorotate dehydrogenase
MTATVPLRRVLYQALFDRVLVHADPERAHHWAFASLRAGFALPGATAAFPVAARAFPSELAIDALGHRFRSPLGVAAGLDKNAQWVRELGALGFGAVEVGTVTPVGQPGNPTPRIARAPADRALINAMGFPNQGAVAVAARLSGRAAPSGVGGAPAPGGIGDAPGPHAGGVGGAAGPVLGANLGKNRDTPLERAAEDYAAVAEALAPHCDYLVLNVSSPNTPGLRSLESVAGLAPIVAAVAPVIGTVPLLVKISPDLADADVDAVAELVVAEGLAGVIATNTTVDRGVLTPAGRAQIAGFSAGGVSGAPLRERSLAVLARLHARLAGTGAIAVSVGGVSDAADVWERILAGATLVQVYTGFVYGGPGWPARVNRELAARVRAAGVGSIGELVGVGA